jgi:DNA (cytosine-5)-methyltransferase 1
MALIDLFCCNGGFSLGAHKAGFQVAAAFDLDPILTSSFAANFPKTRLVPKDISLLTGADVRELVGRRVTGVFGGPPCQGFSDIGRRDPDDPRRELLTHFYRLVSELEPDFFIMENVKGLAYADSRGVLDAAMSQLGARYRLLGPLLLDAADFGAATRRRRLFVIGVHRDRGDPVTEDDLKLLNRPSATVRDAIEDLLGAKRTADDADGFERWMLSGEVEPGTYADRMRSPDNTISGHRIVQHRADIARRFASVVQGGTDPVGRHPRLSWEGQCPTLRAGTGSDKGSYQAVRPLHPTEHRVITVREAARLQGFPDVHKFHRTTWHSFRMIGNSVSPIIAQAIFSAIATKIEGVEKEGLAA